jgi:hypothetical protein
MTGPTVPFIEELSIDAVQLAHTECEITIWGLDEKMIVIGHETVSMTNPVISFIDVLESVKDVQTIMVVLEDGLLLIATGGDMIDSAGIFYSKWTGHSRNIA